MALCTPKATIEEWRPTHHRHYDVSNMGRVRSRARGEERVLKPGIASHGYPTVSFGRNHGSQCVHRLVAAAFLGPCPERQECRHKDDDRTNPRLENLEYGTRKQNVADMLQRHPSVHKLNADDISDIRVCLAAGYLQKDIARWLGVCRDTVGRIARGQTWFHV